MKKAENPYKYKIRICFIVFSIFFTTLFLRAFYLQVVPDSKLKRVRENQETGTVSLSSPRGTIYDRNGRALAVSIQLPSIYMDPSSLRIGRKDMEKIAGILRLPVSLIKQKASNKGKKFTWLKRKVDHSVAKKIADLNFDGIHTVNEWDRFYPDRESASQIIGVVGMDGEGLEGIEKYYEDFLYSTPSVTKMRKDAKGRIIGVDTQLFQQGKQGVDVYLTIDSTIQYLLERELITNAIKHHVKQAMGMVFDPNTGEILAMSSFPQANPNRLEGNQDMLSLRNLNVLDVFEPGSILKVFIMAGALENKIVDANDLFDCRKGSLKIGSKLIVNPVEKEWLDPKGILKFSNNVGMARIGMKMGKDKVISSLQKFGFGTKTGIDFPGEGPGMFEKNGKWHDMRLANISFGQGIAVTPIQLMEGLSIIANGGYRVQPYLVKKIDLGLKEEINFEKKTKFQQQLFSKKTIQTIHSWMEGVTEPDGTGFRGKIPGYRTAGKTGTAQIYVQATKEYSHDELVASFFGFAPVSDPKLGALIIYRQPSDSRYGGEIAAPVFQKVMEQSLHYIDAPRDEKSKDDMLQFAKSSDRPLHRTAEPGKMPNFIDLSIREAIEISKQNSLNIEINGSGIVYKQEPSEGESTENKKVKLYLKTQEGKSST